MGLLAFTVCQKSSGGTVLASGSSAGPGTAAKPASPAATPDCSAEFPQLPLSEMPEAARLEFCKFASDNLCYCGCPHTVGGCLKEHGACRHAIRMATLALAEITGGSGTAEAAGKFVTGYYDSFKAENRAPLQTTGFPCRGPDNAKLTMVEFSDFDCPHCKAARPLFEKLVQDRHDTRLCFASFPLHKHSGLAAAAAAYAAKKGAFWRFHDLLFEDQDARATLDEDAYVDALVKLAPKAGLDEAGMRAAVTDPSVAKLVEDQRDAAHKLGIDGTPWVFVNGRPVPPFSAELYQLSLDDESEWISHNNHWADD
jgi:predicted DsbA family dithiol-disulfide isomerase